MSISAVANWPVRNIVVIKVRYGLALIEKMLNGIVLVVIITFLLCSGLYPAFHQEIDHSDNHYSNNNTATNQTAGNTASITVTAVPDYTP